MVALEVTSDNGLLTVVISFQTPVLDTEPHLAAQCPRFSNVKRKTSGPPVFKGECLLVEKEEMSIIWIVYGVSVTSSSRLERPINGCCKAHLIGLLVMLDRIL